jgi:hypothetical protein
MNRTPPVEVRRELRKEVGFGCPVPDCANPYLYWHHFDPAWHEREHHDPAGMIALCAEHHAKADAGAFTKDQLRLFKENGRARAFEVKGRFDWMRRDLLAVIGGSMYLRVPIIFQFQNEPAIWFNRDEDGYLLLNFRMLTISGQPRVRVEDNFWLPRGDPDDLDCPPNGRKLRVQYNNGDSLSVQFFDAIDADDLLRRYTNAHPAVRSQIGYPVTAVEVSFSVGGTNIACTPTKAVWPGNLHITGSFFADARVAIAIN